MKAEIAVLAIITLLISLVISLVVCQLFDWNMFVKDNMGFKLLEYSLLAAISIFLIKKSNLTVGAVVILIVSAIKIMLIPQTAVIASLGSFWLYGIFTIAHYLAFYYIFAVFFRGTKTRYMRNLLFSLTAGSTFALIQSAFHLIADIALTTNLFLLYFRFGFIFMLTISFAVAVSTQTFGWLKQKFL